ncbi:MAG: DeoR family transcriptional regulator [Vicinamibacterales bacterium]
MKRGRSALVVRSLRLLLALDSRRAHGLSLVEAREVCGEDVCERTIRRDLEALAEVFPVEHDHGAARYRLVTDGFQCGLLPGSR